MYTATYADIISVILFVLLANGQLRRGRGRGRDGLAALDQ